MDKIQLIDKLVNVFGFKGVADHTTTLASRDITPVIIDDINNIMPEIKKNFKMARFNLSEKDYVIDTPVAAFSLLKKCLKSANIGFDIIHQRDKDSLRLNSPNKKLIEYIKTKMEDSFHNTNPGKIESYDDLCNMLTSLKSVVYTPDDPYKKSLFEWLLNTYHDASIFTYNVNIAKYDNIYINNNTFEVVIDMCRIADVAFNIKYNFMKCNCRDSMDEVISNVIKTYVTLGNTVLFNDIEEKYIEYQKNNTNVDANVMKYCIPPNGAQVHIVFSKSYLKEFLDEIDDGLQIEFSCEMVYLQEHIRRKIPHYLCSNSDKDMKENVQKLIVCDHIDDIRLPVNDYDVVHNIKIKMVNNKLLPSGEKIKAYAYLSGSEHLYRDYEFGDYTEEYTLPLTNIAPYYVYLARYSILSIKIELEDKKHQQDGKYKVLIEFTGEKKSSYNKIVDQVYMTSNLIYTNNTCGPRWSK